MQIPFIHTTQDDIKYALLSNLDYISSRIIADGTFDKINLDCTTELLAHVEPGLVLDIGANIGSYTIPLAKQHTQFVFHTFEVQRFVHLQLCTNIFINGLDNVHVHHNAISNENKKEVIRTLNINCTNVGGCSISETARSLRGDADSIYSQHDLIDFKTIDSFDFNNVRLIKIDVEGMEREVLEGAAETIQRNNHPPVLFEAWSGTWFQQEYHKIFQALQQLEYNYIVRIQDDDFVAFQDQAQADLFGINAWLAQR